MSAATPASITPRAQGARRGGDRGMGNRHCLLLLLLVQVFIFAVVNPRGDFPLNDGWVYAHSVRWLLNEHRVRLSDWTTPNLLPQILIAGSVTAVFGYSLELLRHVTQIVAAILSVALFQWFRTLRFTPVQALVASVAIIAMPCWPVLANSFMSDLYGLLFAVSASTFFLRVLAGDTPTRTLALATALGILGTLERQVVIVVPFAFMIASWFTPGERDWRAFARAVLPFALALASATAYHLYLLDGPGLPTAQHEVESRVLPMLANAFAGREGARAAVAANVLSMTGYLGLMSLGWFAWWGMGGAPRTLRWIVMGGGAVAAAAALVFLWLPPYRDHFVIDAAGIGPFTLYDGVPRDLFAFDRSPGVLWRVAGIGAAFGAVGWATLGLASIADIVRKGRAASREQVFALVVVTAYLVPFAITDYFDRYLLFVLPYAFALWAIAWPHVDTHVPRVRSGIAITWIVAMLALSSVATHDYFAWNRVRWQAIALAESLGATPDTLDGGYEYNGYRSDEGRSRVPGKSWWWVKDDLYIVSFSLLPGYREIRRLPVPAWLPRTPAEIYLLKRA
jgi:hypothetical protein